MVTDAQTKMFHQTISGGYNLNIDSSQAHLQLSASDYQITVINDLQQNPDVVDVFSVNYDTRYNPPPAPLLVNGTVWTGSTPDQIAFRLTWPSTTFDDPDEPKLTADRPLTPGSTITSFVGSSSSVKLINITSISAITPAWGDYNYDGKVDVNDYAEWQKAFGEADPAFAYADGNRDGVVDASDYTVWRDALRPTSGLAAAVPEPSSLRLVAAAAACVIVTQIVCKS
jgi:hypothetical protein